MRSKCFPLSFFLGNFSKVFKAGSLLLRGNRLLRTTFWCGAVPFIIGTICFFLWWWFRSPLFGLMGLFTIYIALFLFFIGLVCLIAYLFKERGSPLRQRINIAAILFSLLISNFLIAGLYIKAGLYIQSGYTIVIENGSEHDVHNVEILFNSEVLATLSLVQLGTSSTIVQYISREGSIFYSLTLGGEVKKGVVFGYITSGMGGYAVIKINESGEIVVTSSL